MDFTSRQVFIHVTHTVSGIQYGNIYKSDSSGSVFSLSVANNVRNNYGYCDFNKVKGVNGVYIVNHYDEEDLHRARIQFENAETPELKEQALNSNMLRRTLITYDRGLTWEKIQPTVRKQNRNKPNSVFFCIFRHLKQLFSSFLQFFLFIKF
jgi:hypothetical protein